MEKNNLINLVVALMVTAIFGACSSPAGDVEASKNAEPQAKAESSSQVTDKPYSVLQGDTVWTIVDEMPLFNGGDPALISFIEKNIKYPAEAAKSGTEGKCIVRFCVTEEGKVDQVSILKGVSPELDAEALRVVSSLPKFEYPGMKDGKPAAVWYMVPIQFKLN